MGITISHKLTHKKVCVKDTLDRTEKLAHEYAKQAEIIDIPFAIERESDYKLRIDIGNCETLSFRFMSKDEIIKEAEEKRYSYIYNVLTENGTKEIDNGYAIDQYPQNELYFCSSFCKTQFARSVAEHRFVAELIRSVAGYCTIADVDDEGDYYHSGNINDASESIAKLGAMIGGLGAMLSQTFGAENVITGGETKIKPIRKNKK